MISIKARMKALEHKLYTGHPIPYEELDPISKSIVDLTRELDTNKKREAYCTEHGMSIEQMDEFIRCLTVDY